MPGTSVKPRRSRSKTGQPRVTDLVKDAQNLDFRATLRLAHQSDLLCYSRPVSRLGSTCPNCHEPIMEDENRCPTCGQFVTCN